MNESAGASANGKERAIDRLVFQYGESHQNPTNKAIHWVCVPVIVWTVIALLWAIPFPFDVTGSPVPVNWATIALVLAQVYYFRLSFSLGIGLLAYNVLMVVITMWVDANVPAPLWVVALVVFILAWIGQFVGHKIEGKKPSFFEDVQFLLIGPAWLMHFLYRKLGLPY